MTHYCLTDIRVLSALQVKLLVYISVFSPVVLRDEYGPSFIDILIEG